MHGIVVATVRVTVLGYNECGRTIIACIQVGTAILMDDRGGAGCHLFEYYLCPNLGVYIVSRSPNLLGMSLYLIHR